MRLSPDLELLSIRATALQLGVSHQKIYRDIELGLITVVRIDGGDRRDSYAITRSELDHLKQKMRDELELKLKKIGE